MTEKTSGKSRRLIKAMVQLVREVGPSPEEFRYAVKKVRELTGVKRPVRPRKMPQFYSPGEIYAMMEAAVELGPYHRGLVDSLFQTGLRIAELWSSDLRDVYKDVQGGTWHVRKGKGGKERWIPISSTLLHELRLLAGDRKAGAIFEKNGRPVSVRTFQRWYDEIIRAAGVEKKGGPHTARHTFAVVCRARGIPLEDLQVMMGHEKIETTQIYAQITYTPEQRSRYLQIFEGAIGTEHSGILK